LIIHFFDFASGGLFALMQRGKNQGSLPISSRELKHKNPKPIKTRSKVFSLFFALSGALCFVIILVFRSSNT
jgi:hypothetical protein